MECCHFVSVCHGSLSLHRTKGAPISTSVPSRKPTRLVVRATTTLPETPGSSRRGSYREPQRLLQSEDYKSLTTPSTSGREDEADYIIQLTTSNEDRASLSVPNAGIMLSLISEGGEALVRRILPVEENGNNRVRFQRGAVDVVRFRGPNIGRICALWIGPEAGTWRLEQVTVTTTPSEEGTKKGTMYVFKSGDIRMGDGEEASAVELKPSQISECNGSELQVPKDDYSPDKIPQESARLREASMQEYASLKLFLLGSTAGMVGVGTLGFSLLGAPDMAQGFAVGGAVGFLYLLLIQRAVDQLPSGGEAGNKELKTPAASFALVVGLALVLTRAVQATSFIGLPPQELVAGVLGFFTSKVAVLLAAFRSNDQ